MYSGLENLYDERIDLVERSLSIHQVREAMKRRSIVTCLLGGVRYKGRIVREVSKKQRGGLGREFLFAGTNARDAKISMQVHVGEIFPVSVD